MRLCARVQRVRVGYDPCVARLRLLTPREPRRAQEAVCEEERGGRLARAKDRALAVVVAQQDGGRTERLRERHLARRDRSSGEREDLLARPAWRSRSSGFCLAARRTQVRTVEKFDH